MVLVNLDRRNNVYPQNGKPGMMQRKLRCSHLTDGVEDLAKELRNVFFRRRDLAPFTGSCKDHSTVEAM